MPDAALAGAPLLDIDALSVYYGQFRAVDEFSLQVAEGEIVSIIGANGAGKSSLLKAIVGQAERTEGSVRFRGAELAKMTTNAIVARGIALVPEGRRLFPSLSVEENLRIGWELGTRDGFTFDEIYALFGVLKEKRRQRASLLSGGQQQMVAVGRALLAAPRLLLCDEISLGLAPVVVNEIYALLPKIRERGIGVLVVEQDITRSLAVADRFLCMLEGRVTFRGRPSETDRDTVMAYYFGTKRAQA